MVLERVQCPFCLIGESTDVELDSSKAKGDNFLTSDIRYDDSLVNLKVIRRGVK
jgi:hypothetical protein